jgi:hypothetical protein
MKISANKDRQFFALVPAGTVFKATYGGICVKLAYRGDSSANAVDLNNNDFRSFGSDDVVIPFLKAELHLND